MNVYEYKNKINFTSYIAISFNDGFISSVKCAKYQRNNFTSVCIPLDFTCPFLLSAQLSTLQSRVGFSASFLASLCRFVCLSVYAPYKAAFVLSIFTEKHWPKEVKLSQ
jgi:hypothetical protein